MQINVLGRLVVLDNRRYRYNLTKHARQVLAVLVTNADHVVPRSDLLRELWTTDPPVTAMRTLTAHVMRLRKLLAKAMGVSEHYVAEYVLVTEPAGYILLTGMVRVDLVDYLRLIDQGEAAIRTGDDSTGAVLLNAALDLWRGRALAGVELGPLLEERVAGLEESRRRTHQLYVVVALRLGLHQTVVGDLVAVTADRPMDEGTHGQLMLALYRCGRRSEALAVFEDLRDRIIGEVGFEPSSDLRRLRLLMVNADPVLDSLDIETDLSLSATGNRERSSG